MKIANIIYDDELVNHKKKDYINYITPIPDSFKNINMDLPTLIIGWDSIKKNPNINAVNILDKRIISFKLYWEFSYKEKKGEHFNGIEEFINNIPSYFFKQNYKYVNLDPIFFGINSIDDLKYILPKESEIVYNYKDKMLYVLHEKVIWGIDLLMYGYFNFNILELKEVICSKSSECVDDFDGELHIEQYKNFPNFEELKRYMPIILSFNSIYKESI